MGKWQIDKVFEFDYGHRVWTQVLDKEMSCGRKCICRHIHGHRGKVHIFLESDELNKEGMVVDFVNLNWFKKFVDDVIDHKTILDIDDPLLPTILPDYFDKDKNNKLSLVPALYSEYHKEGYWTFKGWENFEEQHLQEYYEGIVLVPFVPTSENLAAWLHGVVQKKMNVFKDVVVKKIEFFETPKSRSSYII